jgi:YHS domain-containing protein/thiol-disulfide isomerase/thioredoxin
MPFLKYALLATMVLSQATLVCADSATAIQWQTDLDAARAIAEREQKLLLVHFYTESCGPCRMLDATVFNQPNVASVVHSRYVPVKLNANDFQATAERFGITRVPTDVVITPQGRVLERLVSPATPMAYIGQMSGIAEQHRQQVGRTFQVADTRQETTQRLNSAYAALSVPGDKNSFTTPNEAAPTSVMTNQFASKPGVAAPQYGAATTNAPTAPTAAVAASPVAVDNPYTQQSATSVTPAETPPPTDRYATANAPEITSEIADAAGSASAAAPQLPANSPPLGFFGYCPVTMKAENRWQRGDVRWGCYHRGRTYLFASAQKRDEFQASADEFAPALSGIDPVLAIDTGKVEPGKQEFGIDYDGHFYLFSSEENLRKFWSEAERYATGVRQAMNAAPDAPKYR